MATLATLRALANVNLSRADGDTLPWSDAAIDTLTQTALARLWPKVAKRASATLATDQTKDVFTIPSPVIRVSRIELLAQDGTLADRIMNWRYISDTQVIIRPQIVTGYTFRFIGWCPFDYATGADLLARLDSVVAMRVTALAYGALAGRLANSQRQQALDSGRIVDYSTAVGLSAYWERRYQDEISDDPAHASYAPRYAHR